MLPETGAFELNRRLESLVLSGCNGLSRFSVPLLPEPLLGQGATRTIHFAEGTDFHIPEVRKRRRGATPPAGPSHRLRETRIHLVLRQAYRAVSRM